MNIPQPCILPTFFMNTQQKYPDFTLFLNLLFFFAIVMKTGCDCCLYMGMSCDFPTIKFANCLMLNEHEYETVDGKHNFI